MERWIMRSYTGDRGLRLAPGQLYWYVQFLAIAAP